jgi:hypothetical protein
MEDQDLPGERFRLCRFEEGVAGTSTAEEEGGFSPGLDKPLELTSLYKELRAYFDSHSVNRRPDSGYSPGVTALLDCDAATVRPPIVDF